MATSSVIAIDDWGQARAECLARDSLGGEVAQMDRDEVIQGMLIVTGADSAARFLFLSKEAISEASKKIDWIEGLSRRELASNAAMIYDLAERLTFRLVMGPPEGMPHEPQVIAYSEWLRSPGHSKFSSELSALYESVPPDLRDRLRIATERLNRALLPESGQGAFAEPRERYDGEPGLARLESTLQLPSTGDESDRVAAIVGAVQQLVPEWEGMTPAALLAHHDAFSALFAVTEHADLSAYVNGGRLPYCWWARVAVALTEGDLYDRLIKQIHRETHALMARRAGREERSMGGKTKAAKAKPNPEKVQALEYANSHPGFSAVQIKTRLGLRASERTIRGWLSAAC